MSYSESTTNKTKKTSTLNNSSVRFVDESQGNSSEQANNMQGDVEFEEANESCWNLPLQESSNDKSIDMTRLTNKKKQYLQDEIVDKTG